MWVCVGLCVCLCLCLCVSVSVCVCLCVAPNSRRFWATTWLTHWRACRLTPSSATRHGYSSIQIWSNSPPVSVKGATWSTWPPTRWNRPIGPHARGHFNHDHRHLRNANDCSRRPPRRSLRPTTTSTAVLPCHGLARTPQLLATARTVPSAARRARPNRHRRPTHVAVHGLRTRLPRTQARPTLHPRFSPKWVDVTWPPSRTAANWTNDPGHTMQRSQPSSVPSCSSSVASFAGEDNMWLPLFEIGYHYRMGPILLPLCGQYAVRQLSASCHPGLMLAPIAHESVMKASTIPLDGTSVD